MDSQSRLFRFIGLVFALAFTLGAAGFVSAHSGPAQSGKALLQATPDATEVIDPSIPVKLDINKAATTPLDDDAIGFRVFTFKGKANQILSVTVQRITGNLSTDITINSQSDTELAHAGGYFAESITLTVRLPQDGNYTIRVSHDIPGAGDFAAGSVSVLVSDGTAAAVPTAAK
jgi:hypothetical protein